MNPTLNLHLSRRHFIKTGAVGTASLGLGLPALSASCKKIPIGLQLWSIREECKKDLPKALKTVAEIGYEGVEFAGYYDLQAKELRKMLDDHGLVCCGTHTPLETIQPENLAATIEFNQVLGNKYLIVPWMDLKSKHAPRSGQGSPSASATWLRDRFGAAGASQPQTISCHENLHLPFPSRCIGHRRRIASKRISATALWVPACCWNLSRPERNRRPTNRIAPRHSSALRPKRSVTTCRTSRPFRRRI